MVITKSKQQLQLQTILSELEHYKTNYHHLQSDITRQEIVNKIWEQKNHWSQNDNEELKQMLLDKDKKISHLKNLNHDLEVKIRRSENNEEKPYRSIDELEEEMKCLNKIIMDKDIELTQGQRKIVNQESEICRHQQHMKELKQNYDDNKKTH